MNSAEDVSDPDPHGQFVVDVVVARGNRPQTSPMARSAGHRFPKSNGRPSLWAGVSDSCHSLSFHLFGVDGADEGFARQSQPAWLRTETASVRVPQTICQQPQF